MVCPAVTSRKAPNVGSYKCNVDVLVQSNGMLGFGMIVRNNTGLCYAGQLCVQRGIDNMILGEVLLRV